MFNFLHSLIRNTNLAVLNAGIFQRNLWSLCRGLFVIGIFAPLGAYSMKASGFYVRGVMESFVRSDFRSNISKVEFFE